MITDFRTFSMPHLLGLVLPLLIGMVFIIAGLRADEKRKRKISIMLACLIILVRGSRYIMDICVGRFDIYDLFSLQVCHIDLILLVICLIKPKNTLFNITFLIGIPMGLAVALMPGSIHPAPGLSRAILFIMSHMLLVVGAVYLAVVEKMKLLFKNVIYILVSGNIFIVLMFFVNNILKTNFLYIMYAPKGTIIAKLSETFSWPGYVVAMDIIAMTVIISVFTIYKVIHYMANVHSGKAKIEI